MIMTCQCRFMDCDRWATLVGDMNGGKAVHMRGEGIYGTMGIWEFSVLSAPFCCEPQTLKKKKKSIKKKKKTAIPDTLRSGYQRGPPPLSPHSDSAVGSETRVHQQKSS